MSKLGLGYWQLKPGEQTAYMILEEALVNRCATCDISHISNKTNIMKVIQTVLGDNPQIVYFNNTKLKMKSGLLTKQLDFSINLGKRQIQMKEEQLRKAVEDAAWNIDKSARNDRELLQGISEYLQKSVAYDYDELNYLSRRKSRDPDAHNAYGALVNRRAVCDGFSFAYALLSQYFGIRCMVVSGNSSYHNSGEVNHAWNIVEYEKSFYHIDATWDANTYGRSGYYSYDYFGLDDDEIALDHDWDFNNTPPCNKSKLSYYWWNRLVIQSESQIGDMICKELKKGNKVVRMRISSGISLPDDFESYLGRNIPEVCGRAGICVSFRYMWNESTRCLMIIGD